MNYKKVKKIDIICEISIIFFIFFLLCVIMYYFEENVYIIFGYLTFVTLITMLYFYIREKIFAKIFSSSYRIKENINDIYSKLNYELIDNDFSKIEFNNEMTIYKKADQKIITRFVIFKENTFKDNRGKHYQEINNRLEEILSFNSKNNKLIYFRTYIIFFENEINDEMIQLLNNLAYLYPYYYGSKYALENTGEWNLAFVLTSKDNKITFGSVDNNLLIYEKRKEEILELLNLNVIDEKK